MKFVEETAHKVPVCGEFDICVIGGSCTGVFAAVTAARMGAKVAIVEHNGFFGGTASAGLVNIWHSLYSTDGKKKIIGGLTQEVIDRLDKRKAVWINPDKTNQNRGFLLNTAELQIELDELINESGVKTFLHTSFCAPIAANDIVKGIFIENKDGRSAIIADYFIDASGDGDLIRRMNWEYEKSETLQPPTTCAMINGVDEMLKENPDFKWADYVFNPEYPEFLPPGFLWASEIVGASQLKIVAGTRVFGADCSDAENLTKAEIEGRRQVRQIMDVMQKYAPGGDKFSLVGLPSSIGIRETNRAKCKYQLTEEDVLNGVDFEDTIAYGSYRVDIHKGDGNGNIFRYLDGTETLVVPGEETIVSRWREEIDISPTYYQIPYRSIVPVNSSNVLVAGRCLDADTRAYGAVRVMVIANQTGEAAGVAAVLALQSRSEVGDIDIKQLQTKIKEL
jgi:FAD dependent oxidoreductase